MWTLKGLAKCTGAYGTNGTDGAPVWASVNGTLAGNALLIRSFNLDPWSAVDDHFTAGWAMTDDGLYRVTGLPDAPVWTRQLTDAAFAALVGNTFVYPPFPADNGTLSNHRLMWAFTPSVRKAGFIGILGEAQASSSESLFNNNWIVYFAWSNDYGATWNADYQNWIARSSSGDNDKAMCACSASSHLDDVYYIYGVNTAAYNGAAFAAGTNPFLFRSTATPTPNFVPVQTFGNQYGAYCAKTKVVFPFCNSSGNVYASDAEMYTFGTESAVVPNSIRKFTSAMVPVWNGTEGTHPTGTGIDDGTWSYGGDNSMAIYIHLFDENKMVAHPHEVDSNAIWVSTNGATSWTNRPLPAGVYCKSASPLISEIFQIPIDSQIFVAAGNRAAGGVSAVYLTVDYGSNYTRIDNPGGGTLDSVMSLVAGDMAYCGIIVDYYKA